MGLGFIFGVFAVQVCQGFREGIKVLYTLRMFKAVGFRVSRLLGLVLMAPL